MTDNIDTRRQARQNS